MQLGKVILTLVKINTDKLTRTGIFSLSVRPELDTSLFNLEFMPEPLNRRMASKIGS